MALHNNLFKLLINFSVFTISCLLCLFVSEMVLRYFLPQRLITHYPGLCILDDVLGYKLKPGWSVISSSPEYQHEIKINSTGFYDDEFPMQNDNIIKIVLLGDSFIFDAGNPYGRRLSEVLEKRLNSMDFIKRENKKVDVLNLGICGYDPYRYLLIWKKIGKEYKPDLVLLGFFNGNDYLGKPKRIIPEIPRSHYHGMKAILYYINEFLEIRSHLYILLRTSFENIRFRLGLTDEYLPWILTNPERALECVLPIMKEFGEEFKDGPPLLIFQIPHRVIVDGKRAKVLSKMIGISFEELKFDLISKAFEKIAKVSQATSFVDLEEPFKKNGGGRLYYPIDGHWNSRGVEVAAEALLPEIEKILISKITNPQN